MGIMALDGPWTITHVFTMPLPGAHAGVLQLEPQLSMCLSQKPRLWMATRPVYGRKIGSSISPSIGSCPTFPPSPPPPQPPSQTPVACTRTGSITAFISAPLESIQDELEESESSGFLQVPHTGLECEGQLRSPQRHRGSHIKRQRGYLQVLQQGWGAGCREELRSLRRTNHLVFEIDFSHNEYSLCYCRRLERLCDLQRCQT